MSAPLVLAIETSGRHGSVALGRAEDVLEHALPAEGRRHAQTLVAEIASLLDEAGVVPRDVDVVVVSVGPGSFTGLRVGVVAAKTFAYATGCRLVAVDTFDAIAAAVPAHVPRMIVLDDAQRGDLLVGRFEREGDGPPVRRGEIEILPADDWFEGLDPSTVVVGPGRVRFADRLPPASLDPALDVPRASVVAALAAGKLVRGETVDPVALEPRYLRRSSAEVKWDRERSTGSSPEGGSAT